MLFKSRIFRLINAPSNVNSKKIDWIFCVCGAVLFSTFDFFFNWSWRGFYWDSNAFIYKLFNNIVTRAKSCKLYQDQPLSTVDDRPDFTQSSFALVIVISLYTTLDWLSVVSGVARHLGTPRRGPCTPWTTHRQIGRVVLSQGSAVTETLSGHERADPW